jgi:hypothetical protein
MSFVIMLTTIIIGLSCELQFKNEEEVAYIMDEMKTQTKTSETNPPWHKSEMGKKKEKKDWSSGPHALIPKKLGICCSIEKCIIMLIFSLNFSTLKERQSPL